MELPTIGLLVIPVIVGLTEVLKKLGTASRYIPLVAVLLGIGAAWWGLGLAFEPTLFGIVFGLAACGLWSGVKTTLS